MNIREQKICLAQKVPLFSIDKVKSMTNIVFHNQDISVGSRLYKTAFAKPHPKFECASAPTLGGT